jgi:hypothetical protein
MNPLRPTLEIEAIAERLVSFESPTQAIAGPIRFLAYAMTCGDDADTRVIRQHLSDDELGQAMEKAPAGFFDRRS